MGAPARDTDDLLELVDAVRAGILSACASLPARVSHSVRVRLRYSRGADRNDLRQQAYVAARISVLGPAADPVVIAERERVARLDADYRRAVDSRHWEMAAEYLNGFNDSDVADRLRALTLTQLGELRRGAAASPRLGGGGRLLAAIDGVHPAAARVAALIESYESARASGDWAAAAEFLNGFGDADIRERLVRLNRVELSTLRDGAIRNRRLGRGDRLVRLIDSVTAPPLLLGVGAACFDGAAIGVTKNRASALCPAFSGSVGAPTPAGRYCIRSQGVAGVRSGLRGTLLQDRSRWFLLEPQFVTSRSRMMLHPGVMSAGCITVTDRACFDRLAAVLQAPGTDTGFGYDGYPPGNSDGVTNPRRAVDCVAWLDVNSRPGACGP